MNKKFDHLKTSVRQLKRDSKISKDQNAHLTKQAKELIKIICIKIRIAK